MLVTGGGCLKKLIEETVFSKILAVWLWRQVLNKFSPDQFTIHDFNNTNLKFTRLNFKNTNPKFTRRNLYFCNFKNTNPKFTRRYLYFFGENNPPTQVCVWKIHTPSLIGDTNVPCGKIIHIPLTGPGIVATHDKIELTILSKRISNWNL